MVNPWHARLTQCGTLAKDTRQPMDLSERIIPPLREDIVLEQCDPADRLPFAAIDRTLGQKIRLDQTGAMLAGALDRPWEPPQLLLALAEHGMKLSPQLLVRFIRFLDGHYLLSGARAEAHIQAVREADATSAEQAPITFLDGTRHDCVACGHSCGGHDVGPIGSERVAAIEKLMPNAQFIHRETRETETTGHYCAMSEDECSFLRPDRLCSIHANVGIEPKPTDCRVFPLAFVKTPDGLVAGVRLECRSYIASKRQGGALSDRTEELQLLSSRIGSMNEVPPLIRLDGAMTLPFRRYLVLESQLIAAAQSTSNPLWSGLLAVNALARTQVEVAREEDRMAWVFPPDPIGDTGVSANEIIAALTEGVDRSARMNAAAGNTKRAERFARVRAASQRLLNGPLATPELEPDDLEAARDHIAQSLFLKDPLMGPHLRFGLSILNLSLLLAVAGIPEADSFNGALADTLKCLRTGPVLERLHKQDDAVAEWFHDRLENWVLN